MQYRRKCTTFSHAKPSAFVLSACTNPKPSLQLPAMFPQKTPDRPHGAECQQCEPWRLQNAILQELPRITLHALWLPISASALHSCDNGHFIPNVYFSSTIDWSTNLPLYLHSSSNTDAANSSLAFPVQLSRSGYVSFNQVCTSLSGSQ